MVINMKDVKKTAKWVAIICAILFVVFWQVSVRLLPEVNEGAFISYLDRHPVLNVMFCYGVFLPFMISLISVGILLKYRTDVFRKFRFPLYFLATVYVIGWIANLIVVIVL